MSRKDLMARVCAEQIIGVVREESIDAATSVADAYARNGIFIIEITMTTPEAIDLIGKLAKRYAKENAVIAAGTIRGPIRDVPMLAGGPVPLDQIDSYLDAGCVAVNLGASLAVPDLVKTRQWEEIGRRAMLAASIVQSRKNVAKRASPYVH